VVSAVAVVVVAVTGVAVGDTEEEVGAGTVVAVEDTVVADMMRVTEVAATVAAVVVVEGTAVVAGTTTTTIRRLLVVWKGEVKGPLVESGILGAWVHRFWIGNVS